MKELTEIFHPSVINPLHHKKTMANNTLDKVIAALPKFGDSISLFTKKLRLAQYADNSIYDYRLKIAQDEMKPILFLVAHFSKYLMRKK